MSNQIKWKFGLSILVLTLFFGTHQFCKYYGSADPLKEWHSLGISYLGFAGVFFLFVLITTWLVRFFKSFQSYSDIAHLLAVYFLIPYTVLMGILGSMMILWDGEDSYKWMVVSPLSLSVAILPLCVLFMGLIRKCNLRWWKSISVILLLALIAFGIDGIEWTFFYEFDLSIRS